MTSAVHFEFIRDVVDILGAEVSQISSVAPKWNELYDAFTQENTVYKRPRKLDESVELVELNKERRVIASELITTIKKREERNEPDVHKAARLLRDEVLQTYGNITAQEYETTTANIYNMIQDFNKPRFKTAVTALKLTDRVNELDTANERFRAIYNLRSEEYQQNDGLGTIAEARQRSDTALKNLLRALVSLDEVNELDAKDATLRGHLNKIEEMFNSLVRQAKKVVTHRRQSSDSEPPELPDNKMEDDED
ncbi:MAG: DUF6261 family protein [Tannerellaceae bacterium]|nr:DUF6261 family protein [Tannerellaceae bacterium]